MDSMEQPGKLEYELPDQQKVFWTEGFESPRCMKGRSGNIALGTDKGLRDDNEDVLLFDRERDAFAVVDGIGGEKRGKEAARSVGEAIQKDFQGSAFNPELLHLDAFDLMRKQGIDEGGAAYLAGRIEKKRNQLSISICEAGDSQLMVVDQNGKIKFLSTRTRLSDAPRGKAEGSAKTESVEIRNYDCIVAATDGLWDNATAEAVAKIVTDEKVADALLQLEALAKKGMTEGWGKGNYGNRDNITIFIYQIIPVPLRNR